MSTPFDFLGRALKCLSLALKTKNSTILAEDMPSAGKVKTKNQSDKNQSDRIHIVDPGLSPELQAELAKAVEKHQRVTLDTVSLDTVVACDEKAFEEK